MFFTTLTHLVLLVFLTAQFDRFDSCVGMVLINKMFCFNIDNIILVENGLNLITVEFNEQNCFHVLQIFKKSCFNK